MRALDLVSLYIIEFSSSMVEYAASASIWQNHFLRRIIPRNEALEGNAFRFPST